MIEPVQGEGSFVVAPREFMEVSEDLRRAGIVMVVDEVQTGFGRTGKLFAIEHYGIEPDLITIAKSIAMGMPLSGVIGKRRSWTRRATRRSVAPTSGTRSRRRPPTRCST